MNPVSFVKKPRLDGIVKVCVLPDERIVKVPIPVEVAKYCVDVFSPLRVNPPVEVTYPASLVKKLTFEGIVKRSCPVEVVMFHVLTPVEVVKVNAGPETPLIVVVAEEPPVPQVVVATSPVSEMLRHGNPELDKSLMKRFWTMVEVGAAKATPAKESPRIVLKIYLLI